MVDNTEKVVNQADNTVNPVKIKLEQRRGGRFLLSLAFLLSLGAIGGLCYFYYTNRLYQNNLNMQVDDLNNRLLKVDQNLQNRLDVLNSSLVVVESRVVTATSAITSNNLLLLQLNEIVSMANQSLVVYADIKNAIKLLNYGLNLLGNTTDPQYLDLKVAINNDVGVLQQLQSVDPVALVSKLNTIAIQVETLKLINDENFLVSSNSGAGQTMGGSSSNQLWMKFWNNFKTALKSIVVVSSTDNAKEIKLLPEKEIIIRQNLKLYILNARIALLQHDENAWKFNLEQVKDGLGVYFNKSSMTTIIIGGVDELINTNISMGDVGIDATLKALNKLNSLQ